MGATAPLIAEPDLTYGTGSGHELHLDILRPDTASTALRPAIIWIHGGGWAQGDRFNPPNEPLASAGFVTASISYRFSDEAIFPAQIHDVKAAIRYLRANAHRWHIDPERIGVWGGSAGGHLTALAAVSEHVRELEGEGGNPDESSAIQAAVLLCPPTNFLVDWEEQSDFPPHAEVEQVIPALLGGSDLKDPEIAERARLASPALLVHDEVPPVLVVHGTLDDLVPVKQGRDFVTVLQEHGNPAELIELSNDDHGLGSLFDEQGVIAGSPVMQRIVAFFTEHLGPVPPP